MAREYTTDELNIVFRETYGYGEDKKLSDDQLTIIRTILGGRDSVNIMATGGGKSACYLVPAMLLPGVTLVISPLLSLMRDQIQKVRENIPAAVLSSEFMVDKKGFHSYYKNGREKTSRGGSNFEFPEVYFPDEEEDVPTAKDGEEDAPIAEEALESVTLSKIRSCSHQKKGADCGNGKTCSSESGRFPKVNGKYLISK